MATLAQPRRSRLQEFARTVVRTDGWLLLTAGLLMLVGLLSLYSIDNAAHTDFFKKQALRVGLGVGPFLLFWLVRPEGWQRYAQWLYLGNLVLLVSVLALGQTRNNAQRWIEIGPLDFQPSELAKLLVVLTLSSFFAARASSIRTLKTFVLSFVHVAVPMALIYKQPHLGSTLVIGVVWLAIAWAAGCRARHILGSVVAAISLLVTLYFVPGGLDDYQKQRIEGLFRPNKQSSGYQVHRGLVAIGSGQLGGKGYLKGEQKSLRFIPEQQTDFIFTVIGEEGGLMGSAIVLGLFAALFFRIWLLVHISAQAYHRMIAAGVLAIFAFHTVANLGMVLQLLPVVGLWLPFMSYGGTAIWLCMACVALLLSVRSQEDVREFV